MIAFRNRRPRAEPKLVGVYHCFGGSRAGTDCAPTAGANYERVCHQVDRYVCGPNLEDEAMNTDLDYFDVRNYDLVA
ncbi:hypothetical protein J6590_103978 [Homalodisca vitripennis]|nr:hypothetical protein J6590_103978 [Homalodisca vitripennis]